MKYVQNCLPGMGPVEKDPSTGVKLDPKDLSTGPKLIYLDVETTGISCPESGIIQLAGAIEIAGGEKKLFNYRMRPFPQDQISDEALAVNGVIRADLEGYEEPLIAFKDFVKTLSAYVDRYDRGDKFHLVGYNAHFDAGHLRAWFEKNGDKYFGSWFWHPPLDVMGFANIVLMRRRPALSNFKLATVAEALGLEADEAQTHDALYDISLTRSIFHLLMDKLKEQPIRNGNAKA
ncbi:MAG: 3'-5' exonuclease [Armatimonadetes bacterium]|nr:3'-5' exonuclease [Armatimonadota bacterium]